MQYAVVIGFARYDQDRGGAQEDDRISGNAAKILRLQSYNVQNNAKLKCLFVNDGPGLLLGSMWSDYASLEKEGGEYVRVTTLLMADEIVNEDWIRANPIIRDIS